jgi:hypothetical protein
MSNFDLQLTNKNKEDLLIAAKWAKVLAIFGYVVMAIMVLAAVILLIGGSAMGLNSAANQANLPSSALSILYFVMAAFYYFPVTFMYKMSKYLRAAINNSTQTEFDLGIGFLAKFFKFSGYMTIGIIALYVVILIGVVVVGISAALT